MSDIHSVGFAWMSGSRSNILVMFLYIIDLEIFLALGSSEIFGEMKVLVAAEDTGGVKGKDCIYNIFILYGTESVNEDSI